MKTYNFDVSYIFTEDRKIETTVTSENLLDAYDQVKIMFPDFHIIKILEVKK